MSDEIDTYLSISENKFEIFLFDKTSSKNLYKEVIEVKDTSKEINFNILSDFFRKKYIYNRKINREIYSKYFFSNIK